MVERFNAYVNDPSHYKPDSGTGLSVTTPPPSPEPSLSALVGLGELAHVDLVLPSIPSSREAERHWMAFAQSHKEILYITGNPSYAAFKLTGEQPLHLNIWFKGADRSAVESLIRELEEAAGSARQQNGASKESHFTTGHGDVGQFILQKAVAYGGIPASTNGLPAISDEWNYSEPDGEGSVLIHMAPELYRATQAFLLQAFGPPRSGPGKLGPTVADDGKSGSGVYRLTPRGGGIIFRYDTNNTVVFVVSPASQKNESQPR